MEHDDDDDDDDDDPLQCHSTHKHTRKLLAMLSQI
jgi:hypothetical protein